MKKLVVICLAMYVSFLFVACTSEEMPASSSTSADVSSQALSQPAAPASTGDESEPEDSGVYNQTEGTWFLNGDPEAGSVWMDGSGAYEMYDSEGALLSSGRLQYMDENDKFMMQASDLEDTQYDTFYFEDDTSIVLEGSGAVYTK